MSLVFLASGALLRHGARAAGSRIAITFDGLAGDEVVRALVRHRARATFFVAGQAAAADPGAVRALVGAGQEVASQGYSCTPFPSLDADELGYELAHAAAVLPAPAGGGRRLVRPPGGAFTLGNVISCAARGFTVVLWSVNVAAAALCTAVRAGDIVRLPAHAEAPAIIDRLAGDSFELVAVSDLAPPG